MPMSPWLCSQSAVTTTITAIVPVELPDYPDEPPSLDAYRRMTALEKFVYDWQPGKSDQWREDLIAVFREERAASTQGPERIIAEFLESTAQWVTNEATSKAMEQAAFERGYAAALSAVPAEPASTSDEAMRLAIVRTWNINYVDVTAADIAAWRSGLAKPVEGASRAGQVTELIALALGKCREIEGGIFSPRVADLREYLNQIRDALAAGIPAAPVVEEEAAIDHIFDALAAASVKVTRYQLAATPAQPPADLKDREAQEVRAALVTAERIVRHFAHHNPKHEHEGRMQDPYGAHAWLEWYDRESARRALAAGGSK